MRQHSSTSDFRGVNDALRGDVGWQDALRGKNAGYLDEPFNLEPRRGACGFRPSTGTSARARRMRSSSAPKLPNCLRFQYPAGRMLMRCRSRADLRNTTRGWSLLAQPLLLRDHLHPYRAEMEAAFAADTDVVLDGAR